VSSFPAVANGRVYFGAGSTYPRTYAADAITGELIWNTTTGAGGSYSHSSVAVANGRVYVANYNRDVYALNETTGAIIWQFSLEGYTFNTSPAVANGIVYLGSEGYASGSSYVWALNATTGHIVWAYLTGPIYYSSPAVVDGVVYIGDISSGYSNVYALNASTGTKIWNFTRAGGAFYSSPAVAGGRLYIGSMDSNVYALNTTTGVKVWNHTTGNGIRSSPAVVGGVVYIGSQDKNIYALNASTGAKIWNYTATSLVHVSAPAVADGKVFIGSNDGNFFALNATTGAKIWRYKTLGMGYTQPAVAYGNVYTGGGPMGLIAFGGKQNLTVASTAGGTTNPLPGTYLYPTETYLSVSAIPNAGYRLDHWELDGINVGATNPVSFTLESDHTLSAVFVEVPVPPDIAITDVTPSKRIIGQGYNVSIEVTLTNQGNSPITSYVTGNPSFLTPSQWLTFWSMGDVDKNGYINRQDLGLINSAYWSTPSSMNWNPNADLNSDGLVNWTDLFICFFKQGRDIWSYFLLPHPLGPERVDLQPESSTSLTFVWNTENIKKANYTMGATVDPVSGEIDTADNTFTDGNVTVTTSGDINGDQNVNLVDLILLSTAYGATPADPNWNPEADINTDLIVDVIDLKILGKNYWQSTVTMKDPYDIFAAHNASCSHEMLVGLVSMEFLCSHTHSR
jgi:outer membrane protein assembly factor BamB